MKTHNTKMKGKKVLSFVLAAIMLATTFNIALPELKLNASAVDLPRDAEGNVVLDGITQKRVVSNYEDTYATYANRFFGGNGKSEPTNFVIPGLSSANDYTPQGMTYWKAKDWILISAYDATESGKHSVIYALDGKTTEFVALFKVLNADGSVNTSHGGGIAASEYNFYYADTGSKISYIPLSEMDVEPGTVKEIKLKGSIDCKGELNGVATSYCCYDEGVLWTGNFYISSDDRYSKKAYESNPSVLMGYKLQGNSSAEEWHYLSTNYNVVKLDSTDEKTVSKEANSTLKYKTSYSQDYSDIEITGSITSNAAIGEITEYFSSFSLTEGQKYKIEFISDNNLTDLYMFAPTGNHCNVKQSQSSKVTQLSDGRYHYQMIFTAGLRPTGADSSWPTTQSTDGTYTGTYTMRFDQDSINGNRNFKITDLSISKYVETPGFTPDSKYEGANCAGNPTYCVVFDSVIDCIQYAMVDNGRIYISRSWSRTDSGNHVRQLVVGEIDLNSPGKETFAVNGITRACQYVDDSKMTKFGGSYKNDSVDQRNQMFFMGEALCVIEGYLYMFGESAAWTYNGKGDKCPEPIDVLWKIDQYAIMDELRETDNEKLQYYEQVTSLDQIKNTGNNLDNTDEYIIVYESSQKDPVTQKNILYALDAFGGHDGKKLPKEGVNTKDYTYGVVGHPITEYNIQDGNLYLTNPEKDDLENIRWKFYGQNGSFDIQSTSLYYAKHKSLCLIKMETSMATTTAGKFTLDFTDRGTLLLHTGFQYLWCNDGNHGYDTTINNTYAASGFEFTEQPGTFHANATYKDSYGIIGKALPEEHMYLRELKLYKRVLDKYAEKEKSKVYTNSTAKLQPDGTYTIDLETYAIGSTQYTVLDDQRPTDFVLVLDASGSMTNNQDAIGYHTDSTWDPLKMAQACGDKSDSFFERGKNYNTAHSGDYWFRFPDGEFGQIHVAFNEKGSSSKYERDIWLWAEHPITKRCYRLSKFGFMTKGNFAGGADWAQDTAARITDEDFLANQQNLGWANEAAVMADVNADRYRTDYHGDSYNHTDERADYQLMYHHYSQDGIVVAHSYYTFNNGCTRLEGMQQALERLTEKIAEKANETGLAHRIAVVTFGSDGNEGYLNTGMYTNSASFIGYTNLDSNNYKNAFFDANNFASVRNIINNIVTTQKDPDPDTYSNYGYEMAYNIIDNAKDTILTGNTKHTGYLADGNRSACVIMITDGIPGQGKNDGNKDAVANEAIAQANKVKHKGAYSFTVQMGDASKEWASMGTYIDALSSEYIEANSLTDLGDRNSNAIEYAMSIPTNSFDLDILANDMFIQITANSREALTQLDTQSILRQTLSDKFYAPADQAAVQYLFAEGYYDGLGRLAFRNEMPTGKVKGIPTIGTDAAGNEYIKQLDVSGYDYKTEYISKEHGGHKLIVRITGVLPRTMSIDGKTEIDHINSAISNDSTTGIYQSNTSSMAFKHFPNESFSIPEYTYVLDYGLQMLDTDVNGTLCSVSDLPSKQDPNAYNKVSENGAVAIQSGDQNLLYSVSPDKTEESGYTLIKRDDGTYDWFKINVVPASNVYYEETKMSDGASGKVAWSTEGSQDAENRLLPGVDDPYGWDNAYNKTSPYSNGTALYAKLNSSNKNTSTKTFKFTGTGIDIVSACGRSTGVIVVNIKDSSGKRVKGYIVDTYYENGAFNGSELVSQVPVVNWSGDHGTYTVDVAAMYLSSAGAVKETIKSTIKNKLIDTGLEMNSGKPVDNSSAAKMLKDAGLEEFIAEDMEFVWFDDNSVLNGGTGVEPTKKGSRGSDPGTATLHNYIDGFRVYNPLGNNTSLYPETEKHVSYANVINHLATLEGDATELNGIAYITGGLADGEKLSFAKYQSVGPKNELYLNGKNSVSFKIDVAANEKIMLGLRAVDGAVANAVITSVDVSNASNKASHTIEEINSRTEMYYDITKCLPESVRTAGGKVTITVSNTDTDMLAINHIKFSGAESSITGGMTPRSVSRSGDTATEAVVNRFLPMTQSDLDEIQTVLAGESTPAVVKNGVVTPIVEEEEKIPGGDNNEGDVPQDPDNGDSGSGDSSDSTDSIFDIFSLLKGLIALIKKILFATVGNEHLF